MHIKNTIQTVLCAAFLGSVTLTAKITPPNEFYFTSDVYYVEKNATTATVEVAFVPGSRGYSGSVHYTTGSDGSRVTKMLSFSGLARSQTFSLSIPVDSKEDKNQIVLSLSNPDALITRSNAVIKFK
jgi:hypothetical protein